jgi:glutathione S-transferase
MAAKLKIEKRGDEILIVHCCFSGLIWFSGFRGEDLNVIFYQNMPNLQNRYKSAERKIAQKNTEYMLNYSLPCSCS